jgi:hypothetical protein
MNKLLAGGMAVPAAITFLPIVVSTPVAHADPCAGFKAMAGLSPLDEANY